VIKGGATAFLLQPVHGHALLAAIAAAITKNELNEFEVDQSGNISGWL